MPIYLKPFTVLKILIFFILFLLTANIFGIVFKYFFDHDYIYGLTPLFNFDTEKNIPSLYSSLALATVSVLLFKIAFARKKSEIDNKLWFALSAIFLFLSMDEFFSIHELLINPVREFLGTSGVFYFAWVIPYGIVLLLILAAYLKFLFRLPRRTMILFCVSGSLFVLGAIGFELIGGQHADTYGTNNITYEIITTCEELLEKLGIALFIYTLLSFMDKESVNKNRQH